MAEQMRRLDAAGVPYDVVPGVPAFAAAAASLKRELTVPGVGQTVVLTRTSARSTAMPPGEELAAYAATGATLVLHLAVQRIAELAPQLAEHYGDDGPVAVVARASRDGRAGAARHAGRHRRPGRRGRASSGRRWWWSARCSPPGSSRTATCTRPPARDDGPRRPPPPAGSGRALRRGRAGAAAGRDRGGARAGGRAGGRRGRGGVLAGRAADRPGAAGGRGADRRVRRGGRAHRLAGRAPHRPPSSTPPTRSPPAITANAAAACTATGTRCCGCSARAGRRGPGDDWRWVDDLAQAAARGPRDGVPHHRPAGDRCVRRAAGPGPGALRRPADRPAAGRGRRCCWPAGRSAWPTSAP